MKLSVIAVLSVAMIALASSMAAADVITTGSSGVCFAAYNPGFTVSSSSLIGDHCSAGIQGDVFHVEATGTDYRDAGIVLYNDCSLKLGDLQSVSAASNNNAALCINLWLDTGGNGKLFSYDAN